MDQNISKKAIIRILLAVIFLIMVVGTWFIYNLVHREVPTQTNHAVSIRDLDLPSYKSSDYHVDNISLNNFSNKNLNSNGRIPPDFARLIPCAHNPDELRLIVHVLSDTTDSDTVRNEACNILHRSHVQNLDILLMQQIDNPANNERFQAFCMQHLGTLAMEGSPNSSNSTEFIAAHLHRPSRSMKREALLALVHLNDYRSFNIVNTGLSDPEWSDSKDLIIRCIGELKLNKLSDIRPLAYSNDVTTKISAIYYLSANLDTDSINAFIAASQSNITRLKEAGLSALNRIGSSSTIQNKATRR